MKKQYEKPLLFVKDCLLDVILLSGDNNIVVDPYDDFDDDWFGGQL